KKEALGGGDLWLFAMIGAWLGAKALLPVALLASSQGALIGIVLLQAARRKAASREAAADDPARAGSSQGAGAERGAAMEPGVAPVLGVAAEPDVAAEPGVPWDPGTSTEPDASPPPAGPAPAEPTAPRVAPPVTALPPPKPTGDEELDAWVPPEGAVPFGPFLALGAAEYLFFGETLVSWYLGLLSFHG
ncbi:MAG TPA: A24 family peptidase, partial [Vulgatibacter sp.]